MMMKSLLAVFSLLICGSLAVPRAFPSPFPRPQSDDGRLTSTSLCLSGPFRQFTQRMTSCRKAAIDKLQAATNNANFIDVLCGSIAEEFNCFNTIGPTCLDSNLLSINKFNYLERQFELAYNYTFLGESFINSCPTLRNQKDFVLSTYTGSTRCTYSQARDTSVNFDACSRRAGSNLDSAVDLAVSGVFQDPRSAFAQAMCDYYSTVTQNCLPAATFCMGSSMASRFTSTIQGSFQGTDFNFGQCPRG